MAFDPNLPFEEETVAFDPSKPFEVEEETVERRTGGGITGGAADIGVSFMKGLGTGTRMISDVFGANNPVSKAIAGYEDYMDSLLSAESKQDSQTISRILKDAEGKGILPQIMAGLEAFTVAPAEMTASTLGMMLPNLAGGVYAKAAQLGKAGVIGLQMGIGAAQGTGSVKGQIYTAVQEELRQQGLPEDEIDKVATEAQAYGGKNLDQILIGAGLGAAAASTGAERIMTRLITGSGREASEGIIKSMVKGGLSEAPIEALQGGQEKIAENVALQRIGVDVPTMQGVIPAATMEATAGLVVGGGFGAVEAVIPPEKREIDDIETKSEQTSRELTAANTPMAQALAQELARRENAVKNLQEAYDALEPTSQEAQRLKLELSDAQRKLGAFKETAANAGLSVTITPVEQRQIELARGLAEPAAVTEEAAVAVTPTEAQVAEAPAITPAPVKEGGRIKRLFAGEKAEMPKFRRDSLDAARAMAATGKTTEEIRAVTGWFPGKYDKKMRWEIPDQNASFISMEEYRKKSKKTYGGEAFNVIDADAAKEKIKSGKYLKLKDVLNHETLYEAYPEIKDVPFFPLGGNVQTGRKLEIDGKPILISSITLDDNGQIAKGSLSTLLHEIQHWIQDREGFAKGGSPSSVIPIEMKKNSRQIAELFVERERLNAWIKKAEKIIVETPKKKKFVLFGEEVDSDEVKRQKSLLENYRKLLDDLYKKYGVSKEMIESPLAKHVFAAEKKYGGAWIMDRNANIEIYEKIAGEIESRDVQARMEFTEEQRRAVEPYSSENISPEDAIIVSDTAEAASQLRVEEKVQPVPEAERYTLEEAGIRAIDFFGGKAPDGLLIVNDTVNPNYKMKAGYDSETGEIIVNRAYIKKGESIEDILTHELGHYIYSDPQFQADFKRFLDSMPDDTRADIEAIINESYNEETGQTQIEERQVMAFTALVKASKETLSAWENLKNTIKRWINKVLGTNIKLSDEGAMAVFNVGFKRFKSGERIIRAMGEGTLRTAPEGMTQMDRDYLAAVERGDMETAQRMVDEAAKRAGYDGPWFHGGTIRTRGATIPRIPSEGFFLAKEKNIAESYGRIGSTDPYFFALKNPFNPQNPSHVNAGWVKEWIKFWRDEDGWVDRTTGEDISNAEVISMIQGVELYNYESTGSGARWKDFLATARDHHDGFIGYDPTDNSEIAVAFEPSQIKSADPVTYDDAGNVIPLSQRFRATSPDIRRMAAEPGKPAPKGKVTAKAEGGARAEIAALPYGKEKTTPIGINRKTEEIVQKQIFNGASQVSPEKTAEAYDLIDRLLDPKTKGKYSDEVNEITRSQMSENEKRQVDETIGAVKLGNELFKYAVNLAAKGDLRMLQYLFEYGNDLATSGTATISTDARNLQARANLASWVRRAAEAQKKGVVNAIAIRIFGPGVTKEQMDSIIEAVNKVNKTKTQEVDKVYDDLEATGKAGGVDILGAVQKAMEKASLEFRDPWVMALEVLKGMEGFLKFTYEKPTQNIKSLLQGTPFAKSLANFRKKMEETGGGGLNTTFWKTLSDQENKLGPLGEVDMAINRNLGSIVKDTLIKLGLKGEPPNTKMTLIEQVANILANNDLSNAKMLQADKMISDEIDRRESGALKQAGDNQELKDIIEAEYSALRQAWDEAMSRQLDIPVSDATLRRLISNRIRESKTSLNEITDIIVNDSALGNARKEGIVTSIIQQLDGLTLEGDTKKDYTKLRQALVAQFDQMIENSKLKKRMGTALRNLKKESKEDQQAERMIEKLADLQSDVQTWPKTKENKVRDIVNEDLRQKLDLSLKVANKIKPAWKGVLRQRLVDAGVNQDTAERLTEIVWRQHEINYLNRKMKEVETAVTRGSLAPIVEAIKNTPLSQQQDPKWKRKVAFDYLKNAGLDTATANRLADLMDVTLQKVFVQAQEKAFKDIVSKQVKDLNSRRGMERFLKAIRAGALDPEKNMTSELAAQNGWTGFTSEQVAKLNELDTVINDPDTLDLQRATAFKEIQDIIKTSKLDPTVKEVLSAYYTAQALNGIPTTSVNFFSAVAFSMRDAMTDAMRLAATNPAALPAAFDTFISSWKTYGSEVLFSFKNNVQRRGTVEYLSDDDALLRLYNKGKRQWKEGKRAEGFKNMLFGMMEYVGRWLKALDEGAVSVLEQQGLTRYAMEAMKQAGVSSKDARAAANYVLQQKEMFIVNSIAKGMNKTEAKALSDDVFRGAWVEALSKLKLDSQEVLDSALNDALSVIGRVNNTFDQLRQEQRNLRDNGFVSSWPIGMLERLSEAMNSPNATEGQRVFYRMVVGFALVPARVMREAAWYSPYGGVRFALNWWAKKRGAALPYAQSLGTDLQFRQRMADTIAGSIVLGAALALGTASVDDPDDEKLFKIVITGNGPQRRLDPQFYDTWHDKYSRNAVHVFSEDKLIAKFNIERGFEAFAIPFMLAGAMDDWKIRKRFEQSKKTPADLSDASMILGSAFLSFSRRGPFAAYMDGIASSKNSDDLLSSATSFFTFTGKTFVPIVGTSLARNISDFVSDPVDRTSMEGALWANTPVIGPMMGTKSMNALGETTGAGELSDRFYKLGMPFVFKLPNTPEQNKLRDLIIEKGQGPDIPTRYDARRTMGFELTDKQFEKYVTVYGQTMKEKMLAGYTSLKAQKPTRFVTSLQKYQETARNRAKTAVNNMAKNP